MPKVNLNDRASLEELYPLDDYRRDAGANSVGNAAVHRGIAILSPPDAEGTFEARQMSRQVGENDPEADARFLAPFLKADAASFAQKPEAYGGIAEKGDPLHKSDAKNDDYATFIGDFAEAAKRIDFKRPVGDGEERLKGFRGG